MARRARARGARIEHGTRDTGLSKKGTIKYNKLIFSAEKKIRPCYDTTKFMSRTLTADVPSVTSDYIVISYSSITNHNPHPYPSTHRPLHTHPTTPLQLNYSGAPHPTRYVLNSLCDSTRSSRITYQRHRSTEAQRHNTEAQKNAHYIAFQSSSVSEFCSLLAPMHNRSYGHTMSCGRMWRKNR